MHSYTYAYLVGALIPAPIWALLFYLRRDLRREMLIMSLVGGTLAVLFAPAVLNDYWHPIYLFNKFAPSWPFGGIEDFLYTFFIIGIGSVIYEELFAKRFAKRHSRNISFIRFVGPVLLLYIVAFFVPIWLGVPSLYAALISFALLLSVIVFIRHDLLTDALLSGFILGLLVLAGYTVFLRLYPDIFQRFFDLNNYNGVRLIGIPIEELFWAFGQGAVAGPVYEFFAGKKIIALTKHQ